MKVEEGDDSDLRVGYGGEEGEEETSQIPLTKQESTDGLVKIMCC